MPNFKNHLLNTGQIEVLAHDISILDANESCPESTIEQTPETTVSTPTTTSTELVKENKDLNGFTYRSHNCGELRESHSGQKVTLCGWLEYQRMNKFFTLRDGYGRTQVIVPENVKKNCF